MDTMVIMDMVLVMVIMDTMVKGLLMLRLNPLLLLNQDMDILVMGMDTISDMAMGTMDTMANGQLKLNQDMAMVTMVIMARDLLKLNQVMDTTVMDMDMVMV